MFKKNSLIISVSILLIIGFSIGYYIGDISISKNQDKQKSAYEILKEGEERLLKEVNK